ncbi:MAG: hypothetical protein HYV07_31955 [Deltaproteobacteria bacterium]|nr:hypothetical protein [Deltaproteobacteria bacterium]
MSSLSVRLDPETRRQAKALRASGVVLSEVIRVAIREAYARASSAPAESRLAVLERIEGEGAPKAVAPAEYDVADARQARAAIRLRMDRRG